MVKRQVKRVLKVLTEAALPGLWVWGEEDNFWVLRGLDPQEEPEDSDRIKLWPLTSDPSDVERYSDKYQMSGPIDNAIDWNPGRWWALTLTSFLSNAWAASSHHPIHPPLSPTSTLFRRLRCAPAYSQALSKNLVNVPYSSGGIQTTVLFQATLTQPFPSSPLPWSLKWSEVKSLSRVRLFVTSWTVAHQAPLSMGFTRQEYRSGLLFPSPGDLPNPGIEPMSLTLQADALTSEPPGKSWSLSLL